MSVLKQVRAILIPLTVTIIIPLYILTSQGVNPGLGLLYPVNWLLMIIGVGIVILGLALVVMTVQMFITKGKGTLAPWDPPQHLVVVGVYRYVRNPMISGVATILLGEAVALGSAALLTWFVLFAAINAIYIPLLEEPGLTRRFGEDYRIYQRNVPRWIPRLTPWIPHPDTSSP
jgi:protein-S-isoprenylcysteine O-methyltransferase Ste14